jgi:hypothetical protein
MYRWLAVATVALALATTVFLASHRGGAGGPETPPARLLEHGGIPVVRLSGAPREKGRALGRALADRIREELSRSFLDGLREFTITSGEKLRGFLPDGYREQVQGVAEGAGITFDEALFLDTRFELAAHHLADAKGLPIEGAAGQGPTAAALFPAGAEKDLLVVVHEDLDPPLVLVARPGMTGGFLGISGNVAAAMRPIAEETPPPLHGLVWTLLLRRLLEAPPSGAYAAPEDVTGPISVAMSLSDGSAGTLNLAVFGAAWYAAGGLVSPTTDERPLPQGKAVPQVEREPADRERRAAEARGLLSGPPPEGRTLVILGPKEAVFEGAFGRRSAPLGAETAPPGPPGIAPGR